MKVISENYFVEKGLFGYKCVVDSELPHSVLPQSGKIDEMLYPHDKDGDVFVHINGQITFKMSGFDREISDIKDIVSEHIETLREMCNDIIRMMEQAEKASYEIEQKKK